ncbi:MAG: 3-isopropylmalate dehydratase small subunit [Cardiobacteriaceae bacterium]|nr:3-isopropylmalate dehydratase small subunit [Cardiobacteriaceae bacterium]
MKIFQQETGIVVPLYRSNIDTDAILPKEYLKKINKIGFGEFLFDDWRYLPDRSPNPDFILNEKRFVGAKFLLAGGNFGCGSSREHAVWALDDYGIRCVIAPSFGDIFYSNCFKNGVLPALVSQEDADALCLLAEEAETLELMVDLVAREIVVEPKRFARVFSFQVDDFRRQTLLEGLDDIAQTLRHADKIQAFESARLAEFPWLVIQK